MSKSNDRLYTLNLTVVALVALVAIVGVTAIVLHGKNALTPAEPQLQTAGQVGEAFARGGYLGPPVVQDDYCTVCKEKCGSSDTGSSDGLDTGSGDSTGGPAMMIRNSDDCSDCLQFASCVQCKSSGLCSSC